MDTMPKNYGLTEEDKLALELETERAKLAEHGNFTALSKKYSSGLAKLKNANSTKLWNKLNTEMIITPIANPMANNRIELISSYVAIDKSIKNILDIGFGNALLEVMISAKRKDIKLYGVDMSTKSVKEAIRMFGKTFFVNDLENKLPFPNNYFDSVLTLELLEHISPDKTLIILSEVKRVLKPGGTYIVSVPLNEGLDLLLSEGKNPNAHVRVYTPKLIQAELKLSGFKVHKTYELFAFNNYYRIKSIIAKIAKKLRKPNNIIIICRKP